MQYNKGKELSPLRLRCGKGYINNKGYVILYYPDHPNSNNSGTIFEHRFIMSENLGRPLLSNESVHHKNGVRHDNSINNLELRMGSHGCGQSVDDRIQDALLVLETYCPHLLSPAL
jgi:hypothetical protein